jgi:hypothetical protein
MLCAAAFIVPVIFCVGVIAVLISTFVAAMEAALSTIEATSVITWRMQIFLQGGKAAEAEAELMVAEKMRAFTQAASDIVGGASLAHVHANFQSDIRANYDRLSAMKST